MLCVRNYIGHMLNHLIYEISRMVDVLYMMKELYESTYKRYQDDEKHTSKRLYSAMSETVVLENTRYKTSVYGK